MWGKAPFKARKSSGGDHRPTTTRTFQPTPPVAHSRDLSAKALPTLPGSSGSTQPQPNPRVPSSVYSRDTVVYDHQRERSISDAYQFPQLEVPSSANGPSQGTKSADISPLDSPISRPYSQDSARVSPIEEYPRATNTEDKPASHTPSQIPVFQKRAASQPTQTPRPPPKADTTRWDVYSGEPTTSYRGKAGQVNPSRVSFETNVPGPRHRSNSSKILDWGKEQLHSRKKTSESRNRFYGDEPTPFAPREPWKGQSGRSAMVTPIPEKPRNRSSSRLRMPRSNDRMREMNTPSPVVGGTATFTTTITAGEQNHRQQPKPNVYDAPKTKAASRNTSAVSISDTAPPRVDLVSSPDLSASLTDLTLTDNDTQNEPEPEPEPTSRFSLTTYNPTEAGSPNHSPRNSITPSPPPSVIDTASQSSDTARSIMSRARPLPSTTAPGKRPLRKPTPSEVPSTKAPSPDPARMTAQERIEMLERKRNDLVRRRMNINTIIHELTQVVQPSSIAYDMAAREEVKKTVASLNNELAEIKKEEHDIGLKLLRLWKKREDEDFPGQSGTLWVKRVTS